MKNERKKVIKISENIFQTIYFENRSISCARNIQVFENVNIVIRKQCHKITVIIYYKQTIEV